MSSRSRNKALVILATLLLLASSAFAGRKKLVVLDFDGPKGDKFHDDVVKLLKKNYTVVSTEKWNGKAEELDAGKVTEKNVKKIAKKLKIDGVITGKVEKRRDEYIIRLKLRSGATGEILGNSVQTKADGPRLDSQAQRDIKEELGGQIDELESNGGGGGGDDEEDSSSKKDDDSKKKDDEGSEDTHHKSGFSKKHDMDDDSAKKDDDKKDDDKKKKDDDRKKKDEEKKRDEEAKKDDEKKKDDEAKKDDEEKSDEDRPKTHSKKHKHADEAAGDGEGSGSAEESAEVDDVSDDLKVAPSRRAIDAVVGLSFTARNLSFKYSSDLGKPPPGYKQAIPVAGALVDVTAYPMSFNHKPNGVISGIGLNVMYDQVIKINSQKHYADAMGVQQTADLSTKESRFQIGGVFRYPLGTDAKAIVLGGTLSYGQQSFTVAQKLPNNEATDIPNVAYSMLSPGVFVQAPVIPKVVLNAEAQFHLITNTGDIQSATQYGAATVSGFEFALGADYMLMKNVFVRAAFRYERISFSFKNNPMSMTNTRDSDPDQDVQGAADSYMGGAATVGYVY